MQAFQVYYTELSKYFIALMIAFYTYEGFAVFRYNSEERRVNIYIRQNLLMFLIHLACFLSIFFATQEIKYLFFYIFQLLLLYAVIVLFQMLYPRANRLLINNMCLLLSIGFAVLTRLSLARAERQFVIAAASLAIALLIPFIIEKVKSLRKLTWLYAAIGMAALATVLVLGRTTYGSKLNYTIAGLTFQPSEAVKLLFVFFIAGSLYQTANLKRIIVTMLVAAFHVVVLVVSRDLGSALIFFVVYVLMVYLATGKWQYLLAGIAGGAGAAFVAYRLFSHVQVRVQAFLDPWSVIDNQGYQITQSLFSIANGGLFGLGLYQGNPQSIPFVEAEFIFSAIAEELGLVFAVCVILICLSCFIMFMEMAVRLHDRFYQLVAFGLGITYIFQVFLTIGGGTKFIPLTGLTLPLLSHGGTSVLVSIMMFAIVEGLYIVQADEAAKLHEAKVNYEKKYGKTGSIKIPPGAVKPEGAPKPEGSPGKGGETRRPHRPNKPRTPAQ
ncbi:MAG: FtsW/RodA/SpoVE family cell cycle protein [Lachnospiraceae bacterium]|jgi:cell division protein FtsW (lipid II flippase)|nr:FtsW/RodA/SpoVE family cell cycle protein [Lachnospiraceae bacterium]